MNALRQCLLAAAVSGALCLGGCFTLESSHSTEPRTANPTPPPVDNRPAAEIRAENAQLRQRLTAAEADYNRLSASVREAEATKKDLKQQRESVQDDRDKYKKLASKH